MCRKRAVSTVQKEFNFTFLFICGNQAWPSQAQITFSHLLQELLRVLPVAVEVGLPRVEGDEGGGLPQEVPLVVGARLGAGHGGDAEEHAVIGLDRRGRGSDLVLEKESTGGNLQIPTRSILHFLKKRGLPKNETWGMFPHCHFLIFIFFSWEHF